MNSASRHINVRNILKYLPLGLSLLVFLSLVFIPKTANAETKLITNGSTQIGSFPSSLPNTSFRINTSSLNSAVVTATTSDWVGPTSATLTSTAGWTQVQSVSADDANLGVALGFNTTFNGTSYSTAYISSNTYITFGSGSSLYSALAANVPAIPGVHLCAADNSYQKVFYKLDRTGVMRVRYEGNNSTSGVVGSPTIVYEAVFYSGQSYFDVHIGSNSRCAGDATPPTITNVSSDKANGSYKAGDVIDIDVTFSETVTSTGNVTVTLETGTVDRTCTFTVSGSNTGTCNYTVQAGDTTSDLTVASISGTIKDTSNNQMTNFVPATNLAVNKAIIIDTTAPTVSYATSTLANGSYKAGQVVPIQIVFSESVVVASGTPQIVILTGSPVTTAVNYTSGSPGSTLTFNYTVASTSYSSDLDYASVGALSLNGATIKDVAGNAATLTLATPGASNSLAANKSIVIDNTAPTLALTSTSTSLTKTTPIPVTATFSEAVTGFVIGDISVTNGTAGNFAGSGSAYTFTVTPTGQGSVIISVATSTSADAAGNANNASNILSRSFDNVAPTVVLSTIVSSPTLQTPIPYTATFSEDVTGFTLSDITVTNATVGNFQQVSAATYTFDVSPIGHPTLNVDVNISINSGVAFDAAQNGNSASDGGTPAYIRFDNHSPTVSVTSTSTNPTNLATIPVVITFSEGVADFTSSDITVSNGSISNFAGTATVYTLDVIPAGQGEVTVKVLANVAQDTATNLNLVSNTLSRYSDNVTPSIVLTSSTISPAKNSPFSYTATFSEPIAGFTLGDISVTNGTALNFVEASSTEYTFDVTPVGQGDVIVVINSSIASDLAGNANTTSNTSTITYDTTAPTLAEVTAIPALGTDTTPDYVFSTNEAGTLSYSGSCTSSSTSAVIGNNTVTFNTLADGQYNDCTITLTDAAQNTSMPLVVNSFTIGVAPTITSVSSDKANGRYSVGEIIDIDVAFSSAVTSTGNVVVTLETGTIDRTCTFTVTNAATGTCNYTVEAGDSASDLTVSSISGTIQNSANTAMTDFTPATNLAYYKEIIIDTIAPPLSSVSPVDNATGISISANIEMVFDETVVSGTDNVSIYKTSDDSLVENIGITSGAVSGSNTNTITINPSVDLEYGTEYYVQIDTAAIVDLAGNTYAGISNKTSWSFTTVIGLPTLSSVAASNITQTSVTLEGAISSTGGENATVSGFEYGLSNSYGNIASTTASIGVASFTESVTSLVCGKEYHYRSFAINGAGTGSSSDALFTTSACDAVVAIPAQEGLIAISVPALSSSELAKIFGTNTKTSLPQSGITSSENSASTGGAAGGVFTRQMDKGLVGADVMNLQRFLNEKGFPVATNGQPGSKGNETNVFGQATKRALANFQNTYAEQILKPIGLKKGTGTFGESTKRFVNQLLLKK